MNAQQQFVRAVERVSIVASLISIVFLGVVIISAYISPPARGAEVTASTVRQVEAGHGEVRRGITYCETVRVSQSRRETHVETRDGAQYLIPNMRVANGGEVITGRRWLIESAMRPGVAQPNRVIDCRTVRLNGRATMILTTRSGAEWAIVAPRIPVRYGTH